MNPTSPLPQERDSIVVRFAGDSGDGMQLVGERFGDCSVLEGHDISTYPDYPAEIRAPQGTLQGVSGFQLHFGHQEAVYTPGDSVDALVAMNPAALKVSLGLLQSKGLLILNKDDFTKTNLSKAGYTANPLDGPDLRQQYHLIAVAITQLTRESLKESPLSERDKDRCKNFFALGLLFFLFNRKLDSTRKWIQAKFGKKPEVSEANIKVLEAGFHYGETLELMAPPMRVRRANLPPGRYRKVSGNQAISLGLIAAARQSGRPLLYASYPITPASTLLEELAHHMHHGVKTFQAEDEIASIGVALGAAFAGHLAATATSGPGICLKSEFANLAVMAELPLIIVDVQRGGPSTGLPTKVEQADLLQALFGRHGESPMPVLATSSPGDCFDTTIEACRIALQYKTPVMLLSDGYIANGAEPWRVPSVDSLPDLRTAEAEPGVPYVPFARDPATLVRKLAFPGSPGQEHRLGGLETDENSKVTSDADNHERMVHARAARIAGIAQSYPPTPVFGPPSGKVLVLTWGSTGGAARAAVEYLHREGLDSIAHLSLRYLNPLPLDLGDILARYGKIFLPELNLGQLELIIRARFLRAPETLHKVRGQPFTVAEIVNRLQNLLSA